LDNRDDSVDDGMGDDTGIDGDDMGIDVDDMDILPYVLVFAAVLPDTLPYVLLLFAAVLPGSLPFVS
jgi:hypothetical protein